MTTWSAETPFGSLCDEIILQMQKDNIVNSQLIIPYLVASAGAHIINIYTNTPKRLIKKLGWKGTPSPQLYVFANEPIDMRCNIMIIAPPGFGKSLFMRHFIGQMGYLKDVMQCCMSSMLTEAGLIGTYAEDGRIIPGDAMNYKCGILGYEEANILYSKAEYNSALFDSLLALLDYGMIRKRLASGEITYRSYSTVWCATQPMRLNLSFGMARRFVIVKISPRAEDTRTIAHAYADACATKQVSQEHIKTIKYMFKCLIDNYDIKEIVFTERYRKFRSELAQTLTHMDLELLDKFAIGYCFTAYENAGSLIVDISPQLKKLMVYMLYSKYRALLANCAYDCYTLLNTGTKYTENELKFIFITNLGLTGDEAEKMIDELVSLQLLEKTRTPDLKGYVYTKSEVNTIDETIKRYINQEV